MPDSIEFLKNELHVARCEVCKMARERDNARADARELAHAYTTDNRPRAIVVARALAYPVIT
jgi:hypothetical protein